MKKLHCVYFFNDQTEEYEIDSMFSDPQQAAAALAALPGEAGQAKAVIERTMTEVKKELLDRAIADAVKLQKAGLLPAA
jgi:hypothetical protein